MKDTPRTPIRAACCGRPLHRHEAVCIGHWSTVADVLRWISEPDKAAMTLNPVLVCAGRCNDPDARQRMAEQSCVRTEGAR